MIMWILLPVLVVLVMSAGVQAQELREVPASEILAQIQAGEDVNYANVRVTGVLDLSKIELETVPTAREEWQIEYWDVEEELKIVESKITIINSVFGNTTDFSNAQFKKPVDFHGFPGTSSLGISDFTGASFDGGADFGHVRFSDGADFEHVSFGGYANFRGVSFDGDADFHGASFDDYANFWGAIFSGDADFRDVSFGGCADFGDKTLLDNVRYCGARVIDRPYFFGGSSRFIRNPYLFDATRFIGNASFTDASFSDDADFRGVSFSSYADFSGAIFSDDADFQSVRFSCDAEFHGASFDGDADFWGVNFDGDAIFNSAEFNNVILSDTTFTKVSLHRIDFKSMEVEWSSLKDALVFDGPAYIKLIKNWDQSRFGALGI